MNKKKQNGLAKEREKCMKSTLFSVFSLKKKKKNSSFVFKSKM